MVSNIFVFTPIWGNDPSWLIFFKWVETTNQFWKSTIKCWVYILKRIRVDQNQWCLGLPRVELELDTAMSIITRTKGSCARGYTGYPRMPQASPKRLWWGTRQTCEGLQSYAVGFFHFYYQSNNSTIKHLPSAASERLRGARQSIFLLSIRTPFCRRWHPLVLAIFFRSSRCGRCRKFGTTFFIRKHPRDQRLRDHGLES